MNPQPIEVDKNEVNNERIASPKSDYFATSDEDNSFFTMSGELEKEYDFGSASSNRESDDDSWETVSEEMRAEALEHQSKGNCLCSTCSMKSLSISTRIQNRGTYLAETLPENVTKVVTEDGAKIYVVGTAHFSHASQDDVVKVIQYLSPDVVMVELCPSRVGVLQYDEESLLQAAQDVSLAKLRSAIKESGSVVSGLMQLLLLSMSAHITRQLGMAPGGEFRVAAKQARLIPGCRLVLGDRPIQATLGRAMRSLSIFQKLKLGWHLLFSKDDITKEDVEKYKEKDMIAEMLAEMTGDFPELSRVFVEERDQYMAQMLLLCVNVVKNDLPAVIQLSNGGNNGTNGNYNSTSENKVSKALESVCNVDQLSEQNIKDAIKTDEPVDNLSDLEDARIASDTNDFKEDELSGVDYKPVLVAVVGIGHMKGIIENIGKTCDLNELNKIPPSSYTSRAFTMVMKAAIVAAISWGVYSAIRWVRS